ncbi:MAG: rhodanese-like domain-containing protein [Marinomonas sp.]|uniref:Rhodanese domain protein n=1 Tax=Marinomonas sp. (strain MWYL1) TaxID=400668 RepID=A6W2A3_MARMS
MQMKELTAQQLKPLLTDGGEIAFLDIREHGQYGEGHPFFSVHLPFSKIETLAPRLMPCRSVRCVLMDNGDDVSIRAAGILESLGYSNVNILKGGSFAWTEAGYTLFKGVNVPSKTFGELVEHEFDTKSVSAEELHSMQADGKELLLLDGRSRAEFHKMSLPQAKSCPNAELGYRLPMLVSNPNIPVIINCAGRTRSIIGAQSLSLLNISNPVYALKNGTQGWRLAGFDLVNNIAINNLPTPTKEALEHGREKAEELITRYNLNTVTEDIVQNWLKDKNQTSYLFDVRTEEEFSQGHVKNSISAPGGQLVQATDEKLAVRNARIILSCDNGLRSAITAIWLAGMGHKVWILQDSDMSDTADITPENVRVIQTMTLPELKMHIDNGLKILDASTGLNYRKGHIKGAKWVTRARINYEELGNPEDWVLTGSCRMLMGGIARDIEATTGKKFKGIVKGSIEEWRAQGLEIIATPDQPTERECIDYLFFVHDRHDGNLDAARQYLKWEIGLLALLDAQERSVLSPLHPVIK